MSQEEPSLVVSPQETTKFIGGANIVAAHASQLGADVKLLSVTGRDSERDFAASVLDKYNVNYSFVIDSTRPTTLKQRFRVREITIKSKQALTTGYSNQPSKAYFERV